MRRPRNNPAKALSAKDKRLVHRVAIALAEWHGDPLADHHYSAAQRILMAREAPLKDRAMDHGYVGPKIEAMIA